MNKPAWLSLFAKSEPDAIVGLLKDPARFILRADEIISLLCDYELAHDLKKPGRIVRFEEPTRLRRCLITLQARAKHPECYIPEVRSIKAAAPELIERFEAFQAEGWQYLNPQQLPSKRQADRNLHIASKRPRPGSKKLPDLARLRKEITKVANGPAGKHGAVAIVAGRYGVSPVAVRKLLKK